MSEHLGQFVAHDFFWSVSDMFSVAGGPNTRTTQLFLNFGDSGPVLDNDFAPFAEVTAGMDAVDSIFKIGDGPPSGKGPSQQDITRKVHFLCYILFAFYARV